jgi:hypothetical protein
MSTLRIHRSSEWTNKYRAIDLYLDGCKIGAVKDGHTESFEIGPGSHHLEARIDWCGSKLFTFTAEEGSVQEVKLSAFPFANWLLPISIPLLIIGWLPEVWQPLTWEVQILFILLLGGCLTYFFTLGRKKYLRVEEAKPTSNG